jgi:tetratricopeptide (TPR) repeat protein
MSSGCVSKAERQAMDAVNLYYLGNPSAAVEKLRPLADTPDKDFVLNNVRLGSAAMAVPDLVQAEAAFLRAYEVMNSFGVNQGGRTIGAVLVDEKIKIWKGEPFERAMANFYLGLIYYIQHDYGNARAAFENAMFKLRDYGDKQEVKDADYSEVESNFALASLMLGRCWQRLGRDDLALASFQAAQQLRPELAALADPQVHRRSNLLLVIESGQGPRKITTHDGAVVGFGPTPAEAGVVPRPRVKVDAREVTIGNLAEPTNDLLVLAQDRRWQSIDTIRAVKSAIGTGLMLGGMGYTIHESNEHGGMSDQDAAVGAGLFAAGMLLKATSQADVRQWEMLPRTVFVVPLEVEPGPHEVTVVFPEAPGMGRTLKGIEVPREGETTCHVKMVWWTGTPQPPPTMPEAADQPGG